ncbi:hypothetical protein JX265_001517 [Neoarthrinium moseri]|uniref:Isochorismatase-like domain-containing protein n=1 Tax=Neoarthrinium moseri TaxID=1658444 RepID=A0A9P9WVR6_9PEZI|nr:uncharacterized protein JN550_003912 [Neoarthrinium moseri]KAI1844532.1 hypothetical protein JX266_009205 [Neoarthrinium moseri]KAI1872193.1 hypothetical protein JN550_003912 [Neoarthrinium moseri]KAI1879896.1 hypothetical protein JX265_001517 [Neoarthrinium moseri]
MAPNLTFGPRGDQWHYIRSSKRYDLSRGGSNRFTIGTTQGPPETSVTINPDVSALVVVDMQNYFLDSKVVWLNWGLTDEDLATMPASVARSFARTRINEDDDKPPRNGLGFDLGDGMGRMLVAGEWNSEIYPPLAAAVSPKDTHCAKNRMSGMWNEKQPLWKYLEESGKRTLLFTGVNTDQCVLGTLTNAYTAGWDCIMLADCCATTTVNGHDVCGYNVSNSYGFVTDSKAFTSGVSE